VEGSPTGAGPGLPPTTADLGSALRNAAAAGAVGASRATVLYSGGLDSSLIAHLLKPLVTVDLVVIGTDGSRDVEAARIGARLLGLPLQEVCVGRSDVERALRRFPEEFARLQEPLRSVDIALAIAFEHASGPRVGIGQGADELFFGYAHFRGLAPDEARQRAERDWTLLEDQEWPRALRMAGAFGLELVAPFLHPEVVRWARRLGPPGPGAAPKAFLRNAARDLGLPGPLVDAPKRALQYGSGVHRLVSRLVAGEGSTSGGGSAS
jgi:asparagine synthase (glutamine-hydrolysing)